MNDGQIPKENRRTMTSDAMWILGAITLYFVLSLFVLPRLGFNT